MLHQPKDRRNGNQTTNCLEGVEARQRASRKHHPFLNRCKQELEHFILMKIPAEWHRRKLLFRSEQGARTRYFAVRTREWGKNEWSHYDMAASRFGPCCPSGTLLWRWNLWLDPSEQAQPRTPGRGPTPLEKSYSLCSTSRGCVRAYAHELGGGTAEGNVELDVKDRNDGLKMKREDVSLPTFWTCEMQMLLPVMPKIHLRKHHVCWTVLVMFYVGGWR